MARILGAIASSHSPTIGYALDARKQNDPVWAPIFAAYEPIRHWLAEKKPDVLFAIFNDHVTAFFFDHYSHFALGIGSCYEPADEGGGARALPPVAGHAGLAHHIAFALTSDHFDLSFFQSRPLDHGLFSPLSMVWPHDPAWPGAIVPLSVGVLQFPIPSALSSASPICTSMRPCADSLLGSSCRPAMPPALSIPLQASPGSPGTNRIRAGR